MSGKKISSTREGYEAYNSGNKIDFKYIAFLIPPMVFYGLLLLDNDTVALLTREDNLVEYWGALSLLLGSISFLVCFKIKKNIIYLLFGLLLLFGCMEETSYGQRIIGFETPRFFQTYNLQREVNLHNLKWFHGQEASGVTKGFWGKLINMDRLFSVFWFCYFVITPIFYKVNSKFADLTRRFHLPIVPVIVGIIFLMNYILSKGFEFWFKDVASSVTEIKETNFEYLLLVFSVLELKNLVRTNIRS